jgi:predicted dehydrogenase
MTDLRIGVVGLGLRASLAAHANRPGKGAVVTSACDVRPEAADRARELYGPHVGFGTDLDAFLENDLDAVFLFSPDWLHEEQALACIDRGLALYIEKPLAVTVEGCDRILAAARERGTRLFVGHNMRYMTIVRRMKALVDEGRIGEVKSVWCRHFISYGGDAYFRDWHAESRYGTGLLLQKGAHDLDVMHWVSGATTRRVSAFGNCAVYGALPRRAPDDPYSAVPDVSHWPPRTQSGFNPEIDVEDQTVMIMEMDRGIRGAYLQCHFTPDAWRNYTFIGTEGRIENFGDGPESPIFLFNRRTDGYRMIGDDVFRGTPVSAGGHGGADPLIVADFLETLRTGAETAATPQAAREAVAAGVAATESLRAGGGARDVPPLPDELAAHRF